MFKRLFVLLVLVAATVSVSSPAHAALRSVSASAPAASGSTTARPCAQAGLVHLYGIDAPMIIEHYYYSDATYTVQVGYRYNNQCTGQSYMTGTQTSYFIREGSYCSCSLC